MNEKIIMPRPIDQKAPRRPMMLVVDRYKGILDSIERSFGDVCDFPRPKEPINKFDQALRYFYLNNPDIVVCEKNFDLMVPNTSREFLVRVKSRYPETRVVLHSTEVWDNEEGKGGFFYDAVVSKGDTQRLREVIGSIITQTQNRTQF